MRNQPPSPRANKDVSRKDIPSQPDTSADQGYDFGPVNEYNAWFGRSNGVRDPEGVFHKVEDGEEFIKERVGEDGDYEAYILRVDGTKKVLHESTTKKEAGDRRRARELKDKILSPEESDHFNRLAAEQKEELENSFRYTKRKIEESVSHVMSKVRSAREIFAGVKIGNREETLPDELYESVSELGQLAGRWDEIRSHMDEGVGRVAQELDELVAQLSATQQVVNEITLAMTRRAEKLDKVLHNNYKERAMFVEGELVHQLPEMIGHI